MSVEAPTAWADAMREAIRIENLRDLAVSNGDSDLARDLTYRLERQVRLASKIIATIQAGKRQAKRSIHRRDLAVASVPANADERGAASRRVSTLATPVWQLAIPDRLKFVAAEFSAICHLSQAGPMRGVNPLATAVDGGSLSDGAVIGMLDVMRRIDVAEKAMAALEPIKPGRTHHADRRIVVGIKALVRLVTVEERSVCSLMAAAGWGRNSRNKETFRRAIADGLWSIDEAWGEMGRRGAWPAAGFVDGNLSFHSSLLEFDRA